MSEPIYGACPYCGQMVDISAAVVDDMPEEVIEHAAASLCGCPQATRECDIAQRIVEAKTEMFALLGHSEEQDDISPDDNATIDMVGRAVEYVARSVLDSASVTSTNGRTYKITQTKHGRISVTCKLTQTRGFEV